MFIDETISFGTLGEHGRGVTEHFNIPVSVSWSQNFDFVPVWYVCSLLLIFFLVKRDRFNVSFAGMFFGFSGWILCGNLICCWSPGNKVRLLFSYLLVCKKILKVIRLKELFTGLASSNRQSEFLSSFNYSVCLARDIVFPLHFHHYYQLLLKLVWNSWKKIIVSRSFGTCLYTCLLLFLTCWYSLSFFTHQVCLTNFAQIQNYSEKS